MDDWERHSTFPILKDNRQASRDQTLDDDDTDDVEINPTLRAYYERPIAYIFGRAVCAMKHIT